MQRGGVESVRVLKRARALELMNEGKSPNQAGAAVGVSPETARRIGWRYIDAGLEDALYEKPRPGNDKLLNKKQETKLIAIACSEPPEGYARWSTALLAEELIRQDVIDKISRETVRVILNSHDLKPWREKNVVHSR